jgi:hypothetical protein
MLNGDADESSSPTALGLNSISPLREYRIRFSYSNAKSAEGLSPAPLSRVS